MFKLLFGWGAVCARWGGLCFAWKMDIIYFPVKMLFFCMKKLKSAVRLWYEKVNISFQVILFCIKLYYILFLIFLKHLATVCTVRLLSS